MKPADLVTVTSKRTFVLYPALVALEQRLSRRRLHPAWIPLLLWGYLQFRLSGNYRTRFGGGGPGVAVPPERIVEDGIYRYTRNPMYLGHLIFMTGLTGLTRSPLAALVLAVNVPWFDRHARQDEQRLGELFGAEYVTYRDRVPRWLPGLPGSAQTHRD